MTVRPSSPLLRLLVLGAVVAAGALAPPDADAVRQGPCIRGHAKPICYFWRGHAAYAEDGDSAAVNIFGDGRGRLSVRLIGINAMELSVYSRDPARRRGACHAREATARLGRLLRRTGRLVRLSAQRPNSASVNRRGKVRPRRSLAVRLGGRWRDVGEILLREGHALWLPNGREWAWNKRYSAAQQEAAARGRTLWNTDYCGIGPHQATPLRLTVDWTGFGRLGRPTLNRERIRVRNMGAHDLPLGGWRLRDATLPAFRFPRGALVPASETLTFFVGRRPRWDRNHRTHFYWWQTRFRFANVPRPNRRGAGGGAYLLDRQGDLRAWMVYPCRYRCTDGRRGKLALRIRPTDRELIELRNTSARRISLAETVFERSPWIYRFRQSMTLAAGQTLRLFTAGSPRRDTHLVKHWGTRGFFLPDSGGSIRLRTHTNIAIVCRAWGSARC